MTPSVVKQCFANLIEEVDSGRINFKTYRVSEFLRNVHSIIETFDRLLVNWPLGEDIPSGVLQKGTRIQRFFENAIQRNAAAPFVRRYIARGRIHATATQRINIILRQISSTPIPFELLGQYLVDLAFELAEHFYRDQLWIMQGMHPTATRGLQSRPWELGRLILDIQNRGGSDIISIASVSPIRGVSVNDIRMARAHSDYTFRLRGRKPVMTYGFRTTPLDKAPNISFKSLVRLITNLGGFIHVFSQRIYSTAIVLVIHDLLKGRLL